MINNSRLSEKITSFRIASLVMKTSRFVKMARALDTYMNKKLCRDLFLKSELIDLPVLPFEPFFQYIINIEFSSLWTQFEFDQFMLDIVLYVLLKG